MSDTTLTDMPVLDTLLDRQVQSAPGPSPKLPAAKKPDHVNVGTAERAICVLSGSALIAYGISRRSWSGLALALSGAGLMARGATGFCPAYKGLHVSTAEEDNVDTRGIHVEEAITIDKSQEELYRFWRDFTNLPKFMDHLKSVIVTGDMTSTWTVKGPAGRTIQWNAMIINEKENELIAWRSLADADIPNAGSVRFKPAPAGRGTEVHVTIQYYPPGGVLGEAFAKLYGEEPSMQVADDLKRLKRYLETGEIVTTSGQSHGESAKRAMFTQS